MKLNSKNGKVKFLMRAGKDLVESEMDAGEAAKIVSKGEVTTVNEHGEYTICVDDHYFFIPEPKKSKAEKR